VDRKYRQTYAVVIRMFSYSAVATLLVLVVSSLVTVTPSLNRKTTKVPRYQRAQESRIVANDLPMIADGSAMLLDLKPYYRTQASRFGQITQFPSWGTVPYGLQVYLDVPLQVGGFINIWGPHHAKTPEFVDGVKLNRQFETLYVYHGTWYESPKGMPVYDIVFHYEDESVETVTIFYGDDVLDWFCDYSGGQVIAPTGKRSRLAWHGSPDSTGRVPPVRFCLSAIENPQPSVKVTSLDFVTRKSQSTTCVLALTKGKSGLKLGRTDAIFSNSLNPMSLTFHGQICRKKPKKTSNICRIFFEMWIESHLDIMRNVNFVFSSLRFEDSGRCPLLFQ
jgi:hypothetical protein